MTHQIPLVVLSPALEVSQLKIDRLAASYLPKNLSPQVLRPLVLVFFVFSKATKLGKASELHNNKGSIMYVLTLLFVSLKSAESG